MTTELEKAAETYSQKYWAGYPDSLEQKMAKERIAATAFKAGAEWKETRHKLEIQAAIELSAVVNKASARAEILTWLKKETDEWAGAAQGFLEAKFEAEK